MFDIAKFKQELKKIHDESGLTYHQAAGIAGMQVSTFTRTVSVDNGTENPTFKTIAELCNMYNVDMNRLARAAGLNVQVAIRDTSIIKNPTLKQALQLILENEDFEGSDAVYQVLLQLVKSAKGQHNKH